MRSNALDESFAVLVRYCFLVLLDCDLHGGLPLGLEAIGVKALCGIRMRPSAVFEGLVLGPQRSPKTGQWLSPENRPTRIVCGTLIPAGACSLRAHGQCLERREETASFGSGTAWVGRCGRPSRLRASVVKLPVNA